MAYILSMENKSTIRGQLKSYVKSMKRIGLCLFFILLILFLYILFRHKQDTDYFFALSTFYSELDTSHLELYHVMETSGEDHETALEQSFAVMEQYLELLIQLDVEPVLHRDLLDLQDLFYRYQNCTRKVNEQVLVAHSVEMEEISPYYDEAQQAYTFMNQDFKNIYSRLLDYISAQEQQQFAKNLGLLFLLFLCFLVILQGMSGRAERIADNIVSPVQALAEQACSVERGSLTFSPDSRLTACEYQEINTLSQVFEKMLSRIQEQMDEIIKTADLKEEMRRKELEHLKTSNELKNMELHALQMQINPHFLFNTLNMIARTAYLEAAEETMLLLENTASLLRYTLDHSMRPVTLEKEIEMLGSYVYIQEIRFGKRIQFVFKLDESFHQVHVPSLILQPIVENAISHGLGDMISDGRIIVCTKKDTQANRGIITISDNGYGMDHETLMELQRSIQNSGIENEKIGLRNVYNRLQLFFGAHASFDIESQTDKGTVIKIGIPLPDRKE